MILTTKLLRGTVARMSPMISVIMVQIKHATASRVIEELVMIEARRLNLIIVSHQSI